MWTKESFTAGRLAVTWGSCCLFSGRFSPSVALTHAVIIPPTGLPSALLSPFKSLLRFPASYFNRLYHVHPQSNTSVAPGCLPLCLSDSGNLLITELHLCRPGPPPPLCVYAQLHAVSHLPVSVHGSRREMLFALSQPDLHSFPCASLRSSLIDDPHPERL